MWQVGKKYSYTPSGDADEFILKIDGRTFLYVAKAWYERTYKRPFNLKGVTSAFSAKLLSSGRDGSLLHHKGEQYYVFNTDFKDAQEITDQFLTVAEKAKILYNARGGYIT